MAISTGNADVSLHLLKDPIQLLNIIHILLYIGLVVVGIPLGNANVLMAQHLLWKSVQIRLFNNPKPWSLEKLPLVYRLSGFEFLGNLICVYWTNNKHNNAAYPKCEQAY